jgi:hypothetical protein
MSDPIGALIVFVVGAVCGIATFIAGVLFYKDSIK